MNCKKIKKHLSAYVDSELDDELENQIKAHLKTCESCKTKVEHYRKVWQWIGEGIEVEPNPFLAAKIKRRIKNLDALPEKKSRGLAVLGKLLVPATAVVGLVVGMFLGSLLISEIHQTTSSTATAIIDISAEVFSDSPNGSLTAAYEDIGLLNNGS